MSRRILMLAVALASPAHAAESPSLTEMWQLLQAQQQQIEALATELRAARTELGLTKATLKETRQQVADTDAKVEATADELDASSSGESTSAATSWAARTQVGGYAELHYNRLDDDAVNADGAANDLNQVDFHRFVIMLSHQFSDRIRFASELEVEHAVLESADDSPGEVALEQAWVELDLNSRHHFKAGLDLVPIGIINGTHEPATFYGVERNPVELEIIPTTWSEAAAGIHGEIGAGFSYDAFVHSGLVVPVLGGSAFRPRSGRQHVAEAKDQDAALTMRVKYTGIPGLELASSLHYEHDYTGTADAGDPSAYLAEIHGDWRHASGFGLRALYARWHLGSDRAQGIDPGAFNADTLDGWYVEPAYRFTLPRADLGELGVFARYSRWDQRNGLGGLSYRFARFDRSNIGFNYWPHPQLVFKFDAQWESADAAVASELDGFNLGLGLHF
jgi:hypothetical protein